MRDSRGKGKKMKAVIGIIMIVAGIALGLYAGLWWAFIGGIVDVINEIKADDLSATGVAIGVAKVLFAGFVGYISGAVLAVPGYFMVVK
jgi:hypothetical protein